MLKSLSRLVPVAALVLLGGILGGSLQPSSAQAPCRIKHFGCPQEMIDCCCGVKFRCFGSSSQCAAFCSPTLTAQAAKPAACTDAAPNTTAPTSWSAFLAAQTGPESQTAPATATADSPAPQL